MKAITVIETQRLVEATVEDSLAEERIVVLLPLAMRIPNSFGIYSPNELRPKKELSYKEFLLRYADHPIEIRVCFDEDPNSDTLLQRSQLVTAYGFGLDCWYIVSPNFYSHLA